jgi:hypothetical protein
MTYIGDKDFLIEVAKGNVTGHALIRQYGFNADIDDAATYEDVWSPGASKSWQTGAQSMEAVSSDADDTSAGAGARTIRVLTLDASHDEDTQDVTMNGATPVALTGTHFDVYSAHVLTAGATETNEGAIDIQVASAGAVQAQIPLGFGETQQALYVIPNGKTGYVIDWGVGLISKLTTPLIEGRLITKENSAAWRVQDVRELGMTEPPKAPISLPAKTIVRVQASSDTDDAGVRGFLAILLVDD